jgi:toxin ParE1/3/4
MKIHISRKAEEDLENIYVYSYQNFGLNKAEAYLDTLNQRILDISSNSLIGADYSFVKAGTRRLIIKSHTIYYSRQLNIIKIIRVLHHSQDPVRHL